MRKAIVASFLLAIGISAAIAQAPAETEKGAQGKLHVIANAAPPDAFVSLRTDPSLKAGKRLATMPNGTVVKVLQQNPDGWWKVRVVSTGQEGWALSNQNGKVWITCCAPSDQGPTVAAQPSQAGAQPPNRGPQDDEAKAAIEKVLQHEIGEKVKLRAGIILEGYALQNWMNPVAGTGGESLLGYDKAKSEWTILDTDTDLSAPMLVSKGVPEGLAAELILGLKKESSSKTNRQPQLANNAGATTMLSPVQLQQADKRATYIQTINGWFKAVRDQHLWHRIDGVI
ncbi:MAG: SH3 domain-containing protein [Nitrobacter sp.]|uniref:SH3 domain-containing protein n=1 Tax=Nitrobacter sp. TaxID=29420 RepID=UPI002619D906|nr:SH3 domain-containing protein [Nitrobacter sp.]MCV0387894.1 SH3 domain-containing protein [Nitrobacter sp.]